MCALVSLHAWHVTGLQRATVSGAILQLVLIADTGDWQEGENDFSAFFLDL